MHVLSSYVNRRQSRSWNCNFQWAFIAALLWLRIGVLADLAVEGGNISTILSAESGLQRRSLVRSRDYNLRNYFAVELHWDPNELSKCDESCQLAKFSAEHELEFEEPIGELDNHYLFSSLKSNEASEQRLIKRYISDSKDGIIDSLGPVKYFEKMKLKRLYKRHVVDKRQVDSDMAPVKKIEEAMNIHDPEFERQWHLINPIQHGHDINVTDVWLQNITGEGSVVAIVDDGLDFESDDLKANYFAKGSFDFNDHGPNPKPRLQDDRHGTRCAGEVAAVRNNVCGVGAAFKAKVAGIRILSKEISDVDEAAALNYAYHSNHIYSCSWGPPDDGKSMDAPGILIKRAFISGVQKGRNGLGSIFVFATGNGAMNGDNCNFDGYTNSIYSITVGAIDRRGLHPSYAEDCSAQLVVTYSSGSNDHIHTTDVGKQACTSAHGGTSAAAPLAAGIFALALSARPDLTWRDLQYLALQTAVEITNNDAESQMTANGKNFSHRYGYGKLDSYAIVEAAKGWTRIKPQAWFDTAQAEVNTDIAQDKIGVSSTLVVTKEELEKANLEKLEHVQVTVNIKHQHRGDISVVLTSPFGVKSILATRRNNDASKDGMIEWTFMSVAHWGEDGIGNWTLTVTDEVFPKYTGTFENWRMRIWGVSIDADKAKPFPMPKDDKPTSTTTAVSVPSHTSTTTTTATATTVYPTSSTEPTSSVGDDNSHDMTSLLTGWLPSFGMSRDVVLWVYGAAFLIAVFIIAIGIYLCVQRRRRRQIRGNGTESYEFQILRSRNDLERQGNGGGSRRKTRDLYNAFENIDEDDAFGVEDLLTSDEEEDETSPMRAGTGSSSNSGVHDANPESKKTSGGDDVKEHLLGTDEK
ncbi:peptidase S8/S53 domain-containing protein [Dipodascopsis uninucleata]